MFVFFFYSESKSPPASYENLDVLGGCSNDASEVELEMRDNRRVRLQPRIDEPTPLDMAGGGRQQHRASMKRLVRQMSIMDTQRTHDGTMQLTHWI